MVVTKEQDTNNATPMASQTSPRLFASTPVIAGEDAVEYNYLYQRLNDELTPVGVIEEMEVLRIAHISWEIYRLRRLQTAAYRVMEPRAMEKLFPSHDQVTIGSQRWKDLHSRIDVGGDITADMLAAASLLEQLEFFESIDRRLTALELRRQSAIEFYESRKFRSAGNAKPIPMLPGPPIVVEKPE